MGKRTVKKVMQLSFEGHSDEQFMQGSNFVKPNNWEIHQF